MWKFHQRPGDGHTLLLTAGQLVGVVVHPLPQTDILQQPPPLGDDALMALAGLFRLGHQLPRQRHILQRCVLREQVEALEHQSEVQPLLRISLSERESCSAASNSFSPRTEMTPLSGVSRKLQAAQQRGLAAAGGADDAQCCPSSREKLMSFSTGVSPKCFRCAVRPNRHVRHLLLNGKLAELALCVVEQQRQMPTRPDRHRRVEQGPYDTGGLHIGLAGHDQLHDGDGLGKGGILHQRDDLVGHGGQRCA